MYQTTSPPWHQKPPRLPLPGECVPSPLSVAASSFFVCCLSRLLHIQPTFNCNLLTLKFVIFTLDLSICNTFYSGCGKSFSYPRLFMYSAFSYDMLMCTHCLLVTFSLDVECQFTREFHHKKGALSVSESTKSCLTHCMMTKIRE